MNIAAAPLAFAVFVLSAIPARATTTPAIAAFDEAFAKVNDYTFTMRAHEIDGSRVQDRTYLYWFKRPNLAKTLIASGDGKGSGGVWRGGDTVSGHQGGMLSFIHLTVGLHDPRATSLRDTRSSTVCFRMRWTNTAKSAANFRNVRVPCSTASEPMRCN